MAAASSPSKITKGVWHNNNVKAKRRHPFFTPLRARAMARARALCALFAAHSTTPPLLSTCTRAFASRFFAPFCAFAHCAPRRARAAARTTARARARRACALLLRARTPHLRTRLPLARCCALCLPRTPGAARYRAHALSRRAAASGRRRRRRELATA